ncbi:MAG TPA: ATP-binding protein, partial [Luteimonas sp.]|nr:ATP-binding protein [Luteimonas sp.]
MTATAETRPFEAEVAQVLHLVTHSLYSHKEIFLRELVSNASDACDKLRFEAIADPALMQGGPDLHIDVSVDAAARTVTIRDTGVGMTRDEVVANIGTIASSGTRRFLEAMSGEQKADARLIGQFGVGFYSAFVVADRVTVLTRRAGADAADGVRWESDGRGEYTLDRVELPERGTTVVLHLKPDEDEFLSAWTLRALVNKYSDHVAFPIRMPKDAPGAGDADAALEAADADVEAEGTEQAAPGASGPTWDTINAASALWTRPKAEIGDD